ncbi:MAG: DUF4097 family beta strand repeat protein [Gemmatimonadota bacterium]|nr:MAG: DUF4097 family beta strand repeat protein [Gemmatimonadota bacterium]
MSRVQPKPVGLGVLPLLLATMLGLTSCDDVSGPAEEVAEEPFSFDLYAADQSRLVLEGINGTITICGASGTDSLFIDGVRQVWAQTLEDAGAHLDDLQVEVEAVAESVVVRTIQPTGTSDRTYVVNYELVIPARLEVLVSSANGTITIESIENTVSVANANGDITLDHISGSAFVGLANGNVALRVTLPLDGTINISVANGTIGLWIPSNTSAEFSAGVANGTISTSNLVLQNSSSTATSLSGTLGAGQGEILLSVGNGQITVVGF